MVERSYHIVNLNSVTQTTNMESVNRELNNGWILDPLFNSKPIRLENAVIYHLAKFTEEELMELQEEPVESEIVSVRSVGLDGVDELLKEGYTVHALYAKNAVLVKKEAKQSD